MALARSYVTAAAWGMVSILATVSCMLNTEGEGAFAPPAQDSGLGGAGGSAPDVIQPKDQSAEADTSTDVVKPDVTPDVKEAGDVQTEQQECFPGTKLCEGKCVSNALPEWGCDPNVCSPCDLPHAVEKCSSDHCAVKECEFINPNSNADATPDAPKWGDCNAPKWDDGCETALNTPQNCGTCGTTCNPINALGDCLDGTCRIGSCNSPYADCDTKPETGCEVDTNNDVNNCGSCGYVCPLQPGATKMTCLNGQCAPDMCETGKKDCDGDASNGCETDITTVVNCGGCGNNCSDDYVNGIAECAAGVCKLASCVPKFGNCNMQDGDGCETDLRTTALHCGACNAACPSVHGSPQCVAEQCVPTCDSGYTNCEDPNNQDIDSARDGCETNIKADPGDKANCGGCGFACDTLNTISVSCTSGVCNYQCKTNFGNCNGLQAGNLDDGCEASLLSDPLNCGACGNVCSSAGGTGVCTNGVCSTVCDANHRNCDGSMLNGCEVDITNSVANCGACGVKCQGSNATWSCVAGACNVTGCSGGFGDCDLSDPNGCEAPLNSLSNCGGCNNVCGSQNGTASCNGTSCAISCFASYGNCDGDFANGCESSVNTDPLHCGVTCTKCDEPANSTRKCVAGLCGYDCKTGFADCTAAAGCETSTATSTTNCGSCGNICTVLNGAPNCVGGACGIASCASGFGNCDGLVSTGCETDTKTSTSHCGGCNKPCSGGANANPVCNTGVCALACITGYGNCDNSAATGCETDINSSTLHCGGCNKPCTGMHASGWSCVVGFCAPTGCEENWGNCNLIGTDGCEADLLKDPQNCAGCGNICPSNKPVCNAGKCE